ncbi:MAG: hypothetical protein IH986_15835 [Planctomycetes bacterium]|nr:hypothetical protein [Planctomycetota bacterium]
MLVAELLRPDAKLLALLDVLVAARTLALNTLAGAGPRPEGAEAGIAEEMAAGNTQAAASKWILLAETLLHQGKNEAAVATLENGLELDDGIVRTVPAAISYLRAGKIDAATAIADSLSQTLRPQHRAYGLMIKALVDLESGREMDAIDKLRAATEFADLWLIRFHTGRAYLAAGYAVEALADFEMAAARHGEASAIFLDDTPTYRYLATLPSWLDRAQHELGMTESVQQSLPASLDFGSNGEP